MKEGDRVYLSEDVEDLRQGMQGTVVKVPVYFDMQRECSTTEGRPGLAVQFDSKKYPSILRRSNGQWVWVVSKCKKIEA